MHNCIPKCKLNSAHAQFTAVIHCELRRRADHVLIPQINQCMGNTALLSRLVWW